MSAAPRLLQLNTRCPNCGAPPRLRVTVLVQASLAHAPPSALVETYQCHRDLQPGRKCNTIYAITAGAVQRAADV